MIFWNTFKLLGGNPVLIPVGLAIVAWLLAGRAWRMAGLWSALFAVGLGLVTITKIAFLGWGIEIPALDFQGVSGHAMRVTAIVPVILYLAVQQASRAVRICAILLGVLIGAAMGVLVSVHDTHTASEAIAGWAVGGAVSLGFIRMSQTMQKPAANPLLVLVILFSLGAVLFATLKRHDPTYGWLTKTALYLSGSDVPFTRQLLPLSCS